MFIQYVLIHPDLTVKGFNQNYNPPEFRELGQGHEHIAGLTYIFSLFNISFLISISGNAKSKVQ